MFTGSTLPNLGLWQCSTALPQGRIWAPGDRKPINLPVLPTILDTRKTADLQALAKSPYPPLF